MAVYGGPDIITDGLVLCLDAGSIKSYPGSGTTWTDLSGNGNNGTFFGDVSYSSNNRGSLAFDGSADYVQVSNSSSLNPSTNTLICWAKSNTSNWNENGFLMSKRNSFIIHPQINTKQVKYYYYLNNAWTEVTVTASDIQQWNMYACTWDGTKISVFLNGSFVSSQNRTGPINTADTGPLEIGRDDGFTSRVLNGNIASALMYNTPLVSSQINQIYNALKGRFGL